MRNKQTFQVRKWLLSMYEGEQRVLPVYKCKYVNLKNTTHQLKLMNLGEWSCSKKGCISETLVRRIK